MALHKTLLSDVNATLYMTCPVMTIRHAVTWLLLFVGSCINKVCLLCLTQAWQA